MDRESAGVLVEEYLAGSSVREIAAHRGVSTKLVQRVMRLLGAATRPATPPWHASPGRGLQYYHWVTQLEVRPR